MIRRSGVLYNYNGIVHFETTLYNMMKVLALSSVYNIVVSFIGGIV